ncbi:MAG: tetratricopeptide repeat protein [Armatimonadetes bacterium]|nr:tetratricopeptide repeat protein [Armatimonadota bacterium]
MALSAGRRRQARPAREFVATYWLWPYQRAADAKRGQLASAVEQWLQRLTQPNQFHLVYRMLALTAIAAGQTDGAVREVKSWVAKHGNDAVANAVAGDLYAAIGKDTDALPFLNKAANQTKGSLDTVDALARCLRRLGRVDEALDQYAVASRMWPNVLPFYLLRGDMALATQRYEVARAAYRSAMLQAPAETAALAGMTRALLGLERWEEAWAGAGQLLAATPNDPAAQVLYGEAGLRAGKLQEVKDVVALLAAAQPKDVAAQRIAGLVAFGLEDYAGADAALSAAVALDPKDAECWRRLAESRSLAGKYDEAVAALTEGLKSVADVDRAPLYLDLASANLYRQKYDEALAAEAEAEKVLPNSAEPLYLKAMILLYKGAPEELLKALAAALEKDPKAAGQGQQVIAEMERIVEQDAKFDDARLAVAVLYEADGRTRDARKRYREYLAAQPTSPVSEAVKARVAALEAGGAG